MIFEEGKKYYSNGNAYEVMRRTEKTIVLLTADNEHFRRKLNYCEKYDTEWVRIDKVSVLMACSVIE